MARPGPFFLLQPMFLSVRNSMFRSNRLGFVDAFQALFVGAILWAGLAYVADWFLGSFQRHPGIANLLAGKVLDVTLVAGLAVAVVGMTMASLSVLFQDRDLPIVLTAPVDWLALYTSQLFRVTMYGGWPVLLLLSPLLYAVWNVQIQGSSFWIVVALGAVPYLLFAGVVSMLLALLVSRLLATYRHARPLLAALLVGVAIAMVQWVRLGVPGKLFAAGPVDAGGLAEMLATPTLAVLPSWWWTKALMGSAEGVDFLALAAMAAFAVLAAVPAAWLYWRVYAVTSPFSLSRTSRKDGRSGWWPRLSSPGNVMRAQELLRFLRQGSGWTHWALLVLAVVVYVFSLRMLEPASADSVGGLLLDFVGLMNLAVGALLVASVAVHGILPQVSMEAPALWVIRTAPVPLSSYIKTKTLVAWLFMVPVSVGIASAGALALGVSPAMLMFSVGVSALLALAIAALAVWFGVRYPRFHARNAGEVASSGTATVFTLAALVMALGVVAMEAPVVLLTFSSGVAITFMEWLLLAPPGTWVLLAACGLAVPVFVTVFSLRNAEAALEKSIENI